MMRVQMRRSILAASILTSMASAARAADVKPEVAAKAVSDGKGIIVDVREADELEADGMAKPACWLPMSEFKAKGEAYKKFLASLSPEKTVYVYCAVGGRAGQVARELAKSGHKAENIGGLSDWREAKLPTENVKNTAKVTRCGS